MIKVKIGRPGTGLDEEMVQPSGESVPPTVNVMVDANSGYRTWPWRKEIERLEGTTSNWSSSRSTASAWRTSPSSDSTSPPRSSPTSRSATGPTPTTSPATAADALGIYICEAGGIRRRSTPRRSARRRPRRHDRQPVRARIGTAAMAHAAVCMPTRLRVGHRAPAIPGRRHQRAARLPRRRHPPARRPWPRRQPQRRGPRAVAARYVAVRSIAFVSREDAARSLTSTLRRMSGPRRDDRQISREGRAAVEDGLARDPHLSVQAGRVAGVRVAVEARSSTTRSAAPRPAREGVGRRPQVDPERRRRVRRHWPGLAEQVVRVALPADPRTG